MNEDVSAGSANYTSSFQESAPQPELKSLRKRFYQKKIFFIFLILGPAVFASSILIFQWRYSKTKLEPVPSSSETQKEGVYKDWNMYSNPLFGFSFKYPKDLKLFEDQRTDKLLVALDPDEKQFASLEKIATLSSGLNQESISDPETLKRLKETLYEIFDPNIYGPFIEIEASRRYPIYLEHAFDNLEGEQKTVTISNHQAIQKSGTVVLLKESTISPQIKRNRTVTVFLKDKYGYKFTYTSHPKRADFYPIYQDILNSFQFIDRLPTPTSSYSQQSLPTVNPQPSFPLHRLFNWRGVLKLADEKATLWAEDARLHEVKVDIHRDVSIPPRYTFSYVSKIKSQMTSYIVKENQVQDGEILNVTDPEVIESFDRQFPYFSPFESVSKALKTISPNEEQAIDNISSILDNFSHNPASPDIEPLSFTGWLVAFYKREIAEPIRVLVDLETGNVIYKK